MPDALCAHLARLFTTGEGHRFKRAPATKYS